MNSSTASLSNTDPLVVVTQYAVRNFKLNISDDTIKDSLLKHPDYPNISSLSGVFSGLRIKNKAVRIKSSQLVELDPFFFAYLMGQGLVFVTELSGGNIKYYSPTVGLATQTIEKFNEKWNGITLLFDHSDAVKENNFKQQTLNSKLKSLRFPLSICLLLFVFGSAFSITGLSIFAFLLLIKFAGVATCIALSILGIKGENNHFKFCQIGNKLNCNAVLNSPASKLFSWLSLSDIGLVYFTGGLITLLLGVFINPSPSSIIILLSALAVPALFYTLYSLYYQAFILKKWCLLCLTVLVLIWTESILFVTYIANAGLIIPGIAGTSLTLFSFISTVVIWSYLKETFIKSNLLKDFKYRFYRISNNKDVFEALHAKDPFINTKFNANHISIGKIRAENKVLIVLNPFCEKCAKEYSYLLELHAKHPEGINISFLFAGNISQANDLANNVSRHIIELFYQLEETEFCQALSSWFKNKDYEELKSKYEVLYSDKTNKTFGEHLQWLQQHQISQTPALFFNDRRLSDYYSVEQLSHFL